MRTIGRHWPKDAPRGDYQCRCDYCGVTWRRSQLRRDAAGLLACPDDSPGLDVVTLSRGNLEGMRHKKIGDGIRDGGAIDPPDTDTAPPFSPPNNKAQLPPRGFGG